MASFTPDSSSLSPSDSNPANGISALINQLQNLPPREQCQVSARLLISSIPQEDAHREGLERTPYRYGKAMAHLLSGYEETIESAIGKGIFPTESRGVVAVNDIEFFSLCEHHMLPFWGTVSVAYYPSEQIVGLSKIPRLVNLFARRLQVQEHLTNEIAKALQSAVKPRAVVVRAQGQHLCMMMRGVEKQRSFTTSECVIGIDRLTNLEQQRLFAALTSKSI